MARHGSRLDDVGSFGGFVGFGILLGRVHPAGHQAASGVENHAGFHGNHDSCDAVVGHRQSHQRLWVLW
ncbi:Uncharacterised protein [Chlamydia trachomatis]|nr:Uncharacterised protein [Chlamydia trachomatis]